MNNLISRLSLFECAFEAALILFGQLLELVSFRLLLYDVAFQDIFKISVVVSHVRVLIDTLTSRLDIASILPA